MPRVRKIVVVSRSSGPSGNDMYPFQAEIVSDTGRQHHNAYIRAGKNRGHAFKRCRDAAIADYPPYDRDNVEWIHDHQ